MSTESLSSIIKRAFLWHWHLLGLGAAAGFALLSGQFSDVWPLLGAAELAYLGFLGMNPRFQNVLKGQTQVKQVQNDADERFRQIAAFLSEDDLSRFHNLQRRCANLLELRRSMDEKSGSDGVDDFRGESLDRMLWLCLKLLHQRSGLERFLQTTHRGQIEFELKAAEEQLASTKKRDAESGGVESRLTTSINERIKTIRERLSNYDTAQANLELVGAEIDKTEQQITHLCEVGMTSRDSAGLSAQIDGINDSLQSNEKVFSHESIEHLFDDTSSIPPLLSGNLSSAPPPLRKMARQ